MSFSIISAPKRKCIKKDTHWHYYKTCSCPLPEPLDGRITLTLDAGGVCTDARVVLGAVAPTAILVPEASAVLIGRKLDETSLAGPPKDPTAPPPKS